MEKLIFGIDPDVTKSGLSALLITDNVCDLLFVDSFSLFGLINIIETQKNERDGAEIEVRIESAGEVSATFGAYAQFCKVRNVLKKRQPVGAEQNAFSSAVKTVESKGRNAEVANQIIAQLRALGIKHSIISPSSRTRMDADVTKTMNADEIIEGVAAKLRSGKHVFLSKLDAKRFNELFNYSGRTNEDVRDSALLLLPEFIKYNYLDNGSKE